MKALLPFASALALSALVLAASAQTPATPPSKPASAKPDQTAEHRAATYQGPKVVKDSKALGRKMVQKSKPTDMRMRLPVPPVKEID